MTPELLPEQVRAMDYLRRKGTDALVADLRRQLRSAFRDIEALLASWDLLVSDLAAIHGSFEELVAAAPESLPLEPKAIVEMVVKAPATEGAEPRPVHWYERLDWKQFVQALRVHTLEHHAQLERTLSAMRLV